MKRRAQSTLEYAILIAVVVGAFLLMRHYMTRGVQGKLRESADSIGEQYSAGHTTATYTTTTTQMKTKEEFGTTKGVSRYEVVAPATVTRSAQGAQAEQTTQNLQAEPLFTP